MGADRVNSGKPQVADLRESRAGAAAGLLGFFGGCMFLFGVLFSLNKPSVLIVLATMVAAIAVASLVGTVFYNWRMNSIRSGSGAASAGAPIPPATPSMEAVADTLTLLVERDGTGFLDDVRRWESLLRENCPNASLEAAALTGALRGRIPQRLLAATAANFSETAVDNYASQLNAERGLDLTAARWAIRAWGRALGLAPK